VEEGREQQDATTWLMVTYSKCWLEMMVKLWCLWQWRIRSRYVLGMLLDSLFCQFKSTGQWCGARVRILMHDDPPGGHVAVTAFMAWHPPQLLQSSLLLLVRELASAVVTIYILNSNFSHILVAILPTAAMETPPSSSPTPPSDVFIPPMSAILIYSPPPHHLLISYPLMAFLLEVCSLLL